MSKCEIDQKKFNEGIKEIKIKNKLKELTSIAFGNDVFGARTLSLDSLMRYINSRRNLNLVIDVK